MSDGPGPLCRQQRRPAGIREVSDGPGPLSRQQQRPAGFKEVSDGPDPHQCSKWRPAGIREVKINVLLMMIGVLWVISWSRLSSLLAIATSSQTISVDADDDDYWSFHYDNDHPEAMSVYNDYEG